MALLTDRKYSFQSGALTADAVAVVDFSGEESLSRPYRFEILLVADDAEVDLDAAIRHNAVFTIHRSGGDDVAYHGILASFDQLHAVEGAVFYRAVLVPRLWWLSLTHHNQIFLDKTVQEIAEAVLTDGGLTALDFAFRLQGKYEQQPYVCQYGESHLDFLSRWLAREGIYYYFDQSGAAEKVIFTDTTIAHEPSQNGDTLAYAPPSGLDGSHLEETVQAMMARRSSLPQKILLKDYNYEKPSLELTAEAAVDEAGRGEVFIYGEHFKSPEEGLRLAGIRAQELLCRKMIFMGESTVPYVAPGYTMTLTNHYRGSFNQKYLTIDMHHEGSQTGYLVAGLSKGLSDRERRVFYRNTFTAIPAAVQFRPEKTTEQPKITGTLNARIDAAGSGKYAELDIQGRYKVILPFDMSGRKDGKASTWLRMVQPYSGSDHGMHFPLHKGTEVLLTFIEGNPDRPVIAGAAPNPETPSPVTGADQTMAKITTAGGNKIHMEDKEGQQRILLHTPTAGTYLRLGSPNDPESELSAEQKEQVEEMIAKGAGEWGVKLVSEKGIAIQAGGKNEIILGEESKTVFGESLDLFMLFHQLIILARYLHVTIHKQEFHSIRDYFTAKTSKVEGAHEEVVGQVDHVHGEVAQVQGEVAQVQGEVAQVQGEVAQVQGEVAQAQGEVAQVQGEVAQVQGEVAQVQGEVAQVQGEVAQVQGEVAQVQGEVAQVQGEVSQVQGEVAQIRGEVAEIVTIRETI